MITFNYTIKQIYSNSFKFVFVNLWKNLIVFFTNVLLLAISVALVFIFNNYIVLFIEILLLVGVYPCFNALLVQFCTFPAIKKFIIDPYYEEHPDADLDKRRDLGLDIPEEEKTTDSDDEEDDDNGIIFED